ncbi:uncharacterized protein LOC115817109 [Chanos chanos]|uniref:Uncharacterized protein LOC115817109 n=1 Tax=Chanos chanos TaxID=29144 RepID=A0A6J2VWA6_CHACN|nr:uncharacterized protein LOC115817109 [Chanos chanos]
METIRDMRMTLAEILAADTDFVLQHMDQKKLITDRDYKELRSLPQNTEKLSGAILDKLRDTDEDICQKFIDLLKQEFMLKQYPKLRRHFSSQSTDGIPAEASSPLARDQVKKYVVGLGPYSQNLTNAGQAIVDHVMQNCTDDTVKDWLQNEKNNVLFVNYVRFLNLQFKSYQDEMEKRLHYGLIHIVFVAHGRITGNRVPASRLLPLKSIDDVVLYSPWNCSIDAKVAAGIALGTIDPDSRAFHPIGNTPYPIPTDWNSMRRAGPTMVPEIVVSPTTNPRPPTLDPQPQATKSTPPTPDHQPQTPNPRPPTLDPQPQTTNPRPPTPDPQP